MKQTQLQVKTPSLASSASQSQQQQQSQNTGFSFLLYSDQQDHIIAYANFINTSSYGFHSDPAAVSETIESEQANDDDEEDQEQGSDGHCASIQDPHHLRNHNSLAGLFVRETNDVSKNVVIQLGGDNLIPRISSRGQALQASQQQRMALQRTRERKNDRTDRRQHQRQEHPKRLHQPSRICSPTLIAVTTERKNKRKAAQKKASEQTNEQQHEQQKEQPNTNNSSEEDFEVEEIGQNQFQLKKRITKQASSASSRPAVHRNVLSTPRQYNQYFFDGDFVRHIQVYDLKPTTSQQEKE